MRAVMALKQEEPDWPEHLRVRGRLRAEVPMARITWFQVGGPAQYLFKPEDKEDLADFLQQLPTDVPVMPVGVGSNLLVRDGGIDGVVIRLGRGFTDIEVNAETSQLRVGAGCLLANVAEAAQRAGIAGLEFLAAIPGTVGGALRMNAGSYGGEMKDIVVEAEVLNRAGQAKTYLVTEMGYAYRHCGVDESAIFTGALLQGKPGDKEQILATMQELVARKEASQPVRVRTGGSTFTNPEGARAWELIDRAGMRGARRGGAQVSEKHPNFLLNAENATAAEIEELGEEIRDKVKAQSGIDLHWEIKRVGKRD